MRSPRTHIEIDGFVARCVPKGAPRKLNLMVVGEGAAGPGGHVLARLGDAVETLTPSEYEEAWEILRRISGV